MKSVTGLALLCCVAVFLFGCGGGDGGDPDGTGGTDTDQPGNEVAEDRRQDDGISYMKLKGDWTPRPNGYIDMKTGSGMNMITARLVAENTATYEAFRDATVELSKNVSLKPEVTEETDIEVDGIAAKRFEMLEHGGVKPGLIYVWVPVTEGENAGQAWIIKLETQQSLLDRYRPTFDRFVDSVRFE